MMRTSFNKQEPDAEALPFPAQDSSPAEKNYYRLRRHLFCLWTYMIQQDIWEEAVDFIEEHRDEPTPFDLLSFDIP